jgi:polyisoprenoid-binding protein YceI
MVSPTHTGPTRLTLDEVRRLPLLRKEGGRCPDLSTVFRWVHAGVRGVRLHTTRIGGRIYCDEHDVSDFVARLNSQSGQINTTTMRKIETDVTHHGA